MKILHAADIKFVDEYTVAHEPISSEDLIERVAQALRKELLRCFPNQKSVAIACGKGKNGADGMALALALSKQGGYNIRLLCCYAPQDLCSEALHFFTMVKECDRIICERIDAKSLPTFETNELIVDALYGTGLSRPLADYEKQLVQKINTSACHVISVDIPSGMMAEDNRQNDAETIVKAHDTFTLNAPKLAMLLPEYGSCAGRLHVLDIGLHPEALAQVKSNLYYTTQDDLRKMLKPRAKFSHKGSYGHGMLIAGSHGMMGAAVLASRACLHAGVGLLTTHVPKCGIDILQTAVPEAMLSIDDSETHFSGGKDVDFKKYDAVGVGCGIGRSHKMAASLEILLRHLPDIPLVLDADAINLLSDNNLLLDLLPVNAIITPHVKELERLVGECSSDVERLQKLQKFSQQHNIIVVLKGAHTSIALPNGVTFFNATGNPGMATAGSGDVLTGIILALLGQGYNPSQAAILGVGLHGMAGDAAAKNKSQMYITASTIVEHLYVLDHEGL